MTFRLLLFVLVSTASGFVSHSVNNCFSHPSHTTKIKKVFALPSVQEVKTQVNVVNVVNATLRASRLTYSFATLRKKARKDPDLFVDTSDIFISEDEGFFTLAEIATFIKKNQAQVEEDEDTKDLTVLLDGIKGNSRIRSFDDEDQDDELVYGIAINREFKRVIVSFRGTNSKNDILVDLDGRRFPVKVDDTEYEVHNGFRNYLKKETVEQTKGGPLVTKFKIISDELDNIMENYCEGFDIYVTGHSLGGALAVYFGFKLAETEKYGVVNVVSYASPYVGTDSFKDAFRTLERKNKLRHIRVSNANDCIPANPCIGGGVGGFKHAGVNLQLRNTGPARMNYEGVEKERLPFSFILFVPAAASVLIKVLSIFFGFLSFLPTFPLLPSALVAYVTAKLILDNHGVSEYRLRFENKFENPDFYYQTIEELYEERLNFLKALKITGEI